MKLKSAIRKLGLFLGAMIMMCAVVLGVVTAPVAASAEVPTANTFEGSTWSNQSDAMLLPEENVLTVAQNTAAYNTTPVGTYDAENKVYTVSVQVAFNMETFNANHTQIFIMPSVTNYATTISGKFGKAGSTLLGTRAYFADATALANKTMLVRITDYANWRTNVSVENVTSDGTTKHVFTWIITETAVTMQFDGVDLCASGTTPYALLKAADTPWTLADFMDNGTPKAYFGTYNTAWTPLKIYNAGETPVVETEEPVEFESNKTRTWNGNYLYPDAQERLNTNMYSVQNLAQDYDAESKTFRVTVKMSFEQAAYNNGQVVVWVSPMAITDWNTEVNSGLGNNGKLLAMRMYYQTEANWNSNSFLVRICDYKNYSTADRPAVQHDGSSTHTISWLFSESGVTMQFDGADLGSAYKLLKSADTAWTINDFLDEEGNPQAYFGMMNSGGFGNAYLYNVKKSATNKVTFNADNGTESTVKEVYTDTPIAAIANPEKQSTDASFAYAFEGWYNGETKYDFAANVTADITLTAKYTQVPVDYTATVVAVDGSSTEVTFNSTNRAEKLAEIAAMLPQNTAEYTYAWETALPTELAYENVTFTVTKVAVNYTATVVKADGSSEEVSFNVEDREEKLATIAEMKTADGADYTYAWTEALPETLPLENVTYTFTKTAVVYTATVVAVDGSKTEITFTVENRAEKLAEIAALKPTNDANYTYYWAVALPETLPLENVTYTVVKAGESYTATVVKLDGSTVEVEFTVDTRAEKRAEIAALLPQNTAEYTYAWAEGLPEELPLQNATYTVAKTAVVYKATVNGEVTAEVEFTVENKAEKLAEIAAMLPQNTAEYTYAWAAALPAELALENVTFTVTKAAVVYKATVNGEVTAEVEFTVENKAEKLEEIVALLPQNTAEYTYAWAAALPAELTLENATFTVVKTAVVYKATVNGEVTKEVEFTVENKVEKLAEIAALLPQNTAEYIYAWEVALPAELTLENVTFTVTKAAVVYTATVVKADGSQVEVTYTVENRAEKLEEIAAMRPKNTEEFTYGWAEVLPVELPLENGKTYTVTKTEVTQEEPETPPTDDEPTTPPADESKGCGSSIVTLGAAITLLGAVVVAVAKKKED